MDSSLTAANCGHRSSLMAGWVLLVYESCSKRMAQLAAVFNMDFFFFSFFSPSHAPGFLARS